MSYDSYTHDHHLTPRGWIAGTFHYTGKEEETPPPADRVETWREHVTQPSEWSREDATWECVWESPDRSREEREELRKKFPPPSRHWPGAPFTFRRLKV